MPDDTRILRMVEDKINQLLGNVLKKDTTMLNRPPVGGSHGDLTIRIISSEVRLYANCGGTWRYVPLFKSLPKVNATDEFINIDGIVGCAGEMLEEEVGVIRYVHDLQYSGATLQYKYRDATFIGGVITEISDASDWQTVPTV